MGLAVKVDEDLPARVNGWAADPPQRPPIPAVRLAARE